LRVIWIDGKDHSAIIVPQSPVAVNRVL
jgi:hypothetical protein